MKQVTDERGTVREFYRESAFAEAGLPSLGPWLQVNVTETHQGGCGACTPRTWSSSWRSSPARRSAPTSTRGPARPPSARSSPSTLVPGAQVLVPQGVGNGFQATVRGRRQYLYCFDQEWAPGMAGVACTPARPGARASTGRCPIDLDDRVADLGQGPRRPAVRRARGSRPMKLLVTGGAGFIGSNYVRYVLAQHRRRGDRLRRAHLRRQPVDAAGRRRRPALHVRQGQHLRPGHARGGDGRPRRRRALRGREPRRPLDRRPRRLHQHQLLRHQHRHGHRPPARDRPGACTSAPTRSTARSRSARRRRPTRSSPARRTRRRRRAPTSSRSRYHHTYGLPVIVTRCTNNFGPYQYPEKAIPLFTTNLLDGQHDAALRRRPQRARLALRRRPLRRRAPRAARRARRARSTTSAPATRRPTACSSTSCSRCSAWARRWSSTSTDRLGHDRRYSVDITKITDARLDASSARSTRRSRRPSPGTATTAGGGSRCKAGDR